MKYEFKDTDIIRKEVTPRGGGIEISLDRFGFPGERMTAYQNYLGGGMLGRVCSSDTIRARESFIQVDEYEALDEISEALKRFFHELTNPETVWESTSYDFNQILPVKAY